MDNQKEEESDRNLKRHLELNSIQKRTKYIMAIRENHQWKYYVAINNDRHPRTSPGGETFFVLTEEYVDSIMSCVSSCKQMVLQIQAQSGTWIEMTAAFKKQYHEKDLVYDRETIIRKYCSYQRLVIVNPNDPVKEKFYGIIVIQGEPAITDELTFEELKKRRLRDVVDSLRATGKSNSWVTLTHGASKETIPMKYDQSWPETTFVQGNHNACMLMSMSSVLLHFVKNSKRSNYENQVFNEAITDLTTMAKACKFEGYNSVVVKINKKLRAHGFQIQVLKQKKRKRSGIYINLNILDKEFDFGLFCLVQLCGNDLDINHTVAITKEWIFDSNHVKALPLCQHSLDICCSTKHSRVKFEEATLIYKYTY